MCYDMVNYYWCECNEGFYGTNCDVLFDNCESGPCGLDVVRQKPNSCVSDNAGYTVRCKEIKWITILATPDTDTLILQG